MKLLDDSASFLRAQVTQEPYKNGGWLSTKDGLKLFAVWVFVCFAGWGWHDLFGKELPSSEVMEFSRHAAIAVGVTSFAAGGMAHARRRRP